ncbi:type II toxin-antitoxin system RatA family toxin [Pseudonocardia sp. TRM90224]|uniref:type II toxin-antitoxin system RatA family toxin n=1 Tax=Pseudonocardia sp. TRM90224 TaxID=2812678 RepID=UPI001E5AB01C|nr:SRPBCC family protein [Pseudonocardia sp. TRM90224]
MTSRVLKATARATAAEIIESIGRWSCSSRVGDVLTVSHPDEGHSRHELAFRGGAVRWVQRNTRPRPGMIGFEQVDGDFQHLRGSWTCADGPDGCTVVFEVTFSTAVPHLAGAIDSAAGRTLVRSALAILATIAGPVRMTEGERSLHDPLPGRSTKPGAAEVVPAAA